MKATKKLKLEEKQRVALEEQTRCAEAKKIAGKKRLELEATNRAATDAKKRCTAAKSTAKKKRQLELKAQKMTEASNVVIQWFRQARTRQAQKKRLERQDEAMKTISHWYQKIQE